MEPLRELAERSLEWLRSQGADDVEAELYLSRSQERGVELRAGCLDGVQETSSEGAGLRLLCQGRMGFASAGGIGLETVQALYGKVRLQLPHLEPDPHKALPAAAACAPDGGLAASLWDESLFRRDWDEIVPRLKAMEAEVLARDARIRSVLRLGYGESRGEVVIASTRGVVTWERASSASVGLSALSAEGGEVQVGSAFQSARKEANLDFGKAAREAAWRTTALLGGRKLEGGRRAVLFDPWVAGEFLDLIAGLLCADQVQRGKSLLAGKLGEKVASGLVTFVDDPRRPGGVASSLYDDEGCPTRPKTMMEAGLLRDYFYDATTAGKDGRRSNASAGRSSYKGLPGPGSSNFYLVGGGMSREDLISDTKDGILVLDVMGMHMVDPISGELSVGVSGLAVRDGRLAHPVKGAMISGNLMELLERIDAVADDLTFYGAMGSPTFRVADLTVA